MDSDYVSDTSCPTFLQSNFITQTYRQPRQTYRQPKILKRPDYYNQPPTNQNKVSYFRGDMNSSNGPYVNETFLRGWHRFSVEEKTGVFCN